MEGGNGRMGKGCRRIEGGREWKDGGQEWVSSEACEAGVAKHWWV